MRMANPTNMKQGAVKRPYIITDERQRERILKAMGANTQEGKGKLYRMQVILYWRI